VGARPRPAAAAVMARAPQHEYPQRVGERIRAGTDGSYRAKNYLMRLGHKYARNRGWVYRCRSDGSDVLMRRVA
jgi:hypothetical protein